MRIGKSYRLQESKLILRNHTVVSCRDCSTSRCVGSLKPSFSPFRHVVGRALLALHQITVVVSLGLGPWTICNKVFFFALLYHISCCRADGGQLNITSVFVPSENSRPGRGPGVQGREGSVSPVETCRVDSGWAIDEVHNALVFRIDKA